ncbi:hypothetical protein L211DRAFT_884867, partial [Terfezia boudieri ATCC MYA-4762]
YLNRLNVLSVFEKQSIKSETSQYNLCCAAYPLVLPVDLQQVMSLSQSQAFLYSGKLSTFASFPTTYPSTYLNKCQIHRRPMYTLPKWGLFRGHLNEGDIIRLANVSAEDIHIDWKNHQRHRICIPCLQGKQYMNINRSPSERAKYPDISTPSQGISGYSNLKPMLMKLFNIKQDW